MENGYQLKIKSHKSLTNHKSQSTEYIKIKWELELNIIIEDDTWEEICSSCHRGIGSQQWKEFDWKAKLRYFMTPLTISSYIKEPLVELCWRKCGKVGDHSHTFWDCPVIENLWECVREN